MITRWVAAACLALTVVVIVCTALLLRSGRSADEADADCLGTLTPPPSATTGLFVEPDDARTPLLEELDAAQCAIDVNIYLLSDDETLAALDRAHERGVAVRVQLEEHPYGGGLETTEEVVEWLEERDIAWQYTPARFQFSHAKYLVIDRQVAIIMNQNLSTSSFEDNREFAVVTTDHDVVVEAAAVFESDWRDEPLADDPDQIVTSLETSRTALLAMIDGATTAIDFYAEVVRDDAFRGALLRAVARGVVVRLIVNESGDAADDEVYARLAAGGVAIRFSATLYVHAKLMIFDGRTIFVGSQNPTANSFDNNREVGLAVDDPVAVARATSVFERDWVQGIPAGTANTHAFVLAT